ncbi:MAG: SOS response-associated peptidase [Paracoccaceae bacterium]|nr:SOS response-associated peptidase [Paracoccaceae bacterium]
MCGRFTLTHPNEALARLFDAVPGNDLPEGPRYNICPTQRVAVVTSDNGRRLRAMRWGFVRAWSKSAKGGPLLINARAETIATKPAFRDAVRARRCLIAASGFYEWSGGEGGARLPWYVTRRDGAVMAFAGIWQHGAQDGLGQDGLGDDTCAMVTTGAGPDMSAIHHREPVILAPKDWSLWLGEAGHGAAVLMRVVPTGALQTYRVGVAVNSNRASGAALIVPLT